jgi:2-polyprenyl-6-hydroxyphenyl methylase/3-demethylubiquinone-9 3-methyltransferase
MNNDRIAEVYEGAHGSPEQQRIARDRIHWMCRNVMGKKVLDVGCSQGIASLLLGREGKQVVGVDREADSIREAQRRLAEEEEPVQKRARFVEGDGADLDFPDSSFDTVLMGEVIEHLIDARPLIAEARRLLGPKGRLVVTVPYGLFPYPDHKGSVYVGDLLDLLLPRFAIGSIELIEHYLGALASPAPRPGRATAELLRSSLELAESRLGTQDLAVAQQRQRIQRLQQDAASRGEGRELAGVSAELERARAQVEALEQRLAEVNGDIGAADQLAATLPRIAALDHTLELAETRLDELERERDVVLGQLHAREQELAASQALCASLEQSSDGAATAVARLRSRIEQLESGQSAEAGERLAELQVELAAEQERAQALAAELQAASAGDRDEASDAPKLEAELETTREHEAGLSEELERARRESAAAADERVQLRTELARAEANAASARAAAERGNSALAEARKEIQRLSERANILESGLKKQQ